MKELQTIVMMPLEVFLGVALAWTLVRSRFWRSRPAVEWALLALCVVVGLWLRLDVSGFPGDIRLTLAQAFPRSGAPPHQYGAAFAAWQRLLFLVFPASFETVRLANVFIGAGTIVAMYAAIASYWSDRVAALAGAALIACSPHFIRFSACEANHVPLTFALLMMAACTAVWARRGGALWMVQAAGWLILCANVRNEGVIYLPIAASLAWCVVRRPSPAQWKELSVGAAVIALFTIQPTAATLLQQSGPPGGWADLGFKALWENPMFDSTAYPTAVGALAAVGAIVLLAQSRTRVRALGWLVCIVIVGIPTYWKYHSPTTDFFFRHTMPIAAAWMAVAGVGLASIVRAISSAVFRRVVAADEDTDDWAAGHGRAYAAALVAVVALAAAGFHSGRALLTREWTTQLELSFVREHLPSIDDGCRIVYIRDNSSPDQGLWLTPLLSRETGLRHVWVDAARLLADPPDPGCAVYYQAAICHGLAVAERDDPRIMYPPCADVTARYDLDPIVEAHLPAHPYVGERYTVDPVPVGFYRLVPRSVPVELDR